MKHLIAGAITAAGLAVGSASAQQEIASTHYGALTYGLPIAVAYHGGFFAEEGVELDGILSARGGGDAVRTVLASALPWGEAGLPAVIAARNSGLDLVITNIAVGNVGDAMWVTRKGSGIASVKDLEGQTVTFTNPKSGSEMNLTTVLEREGLTDKVTTVASGGMREGLTLVGQGEAAAAPIVEPMATLMADKFDVVFRVSDYFEPGAQIVGFAPREFAEANPELITGLIAGRAKAVELMRSDPARAAEIATAAYDRVPAPVLPQIIERLTGEGFWSTGELDLDAFKAMEEILVNVEVIDAPGYDWASAIDDRWVEAALAR